MVYSFQERKATYVPVTLSGHSLPTGWARELIKPSIDEESLIV